MADNIQNAIKTLAEDWENHSGAEVQAFLKGMLSNMASRIEAVSSSKVGEIRMSPGADGEVSVRFFADTERSRTRARMPHFCWARCRFV